MEDQLEQTMMAKTLQKAQGIRPDRVAEVDNFARQVVEGLGPGSLTRVVSRAPRINLLRDTRSESMQDKMKQVFDQLLDVGYKAISRKGRQKATNAVNNYYNAMEGVGIVSPTGIPKPIPAVSKPAAETKEFIAILESFLGSGGYNPKPEELSIIRDVVRMPDKGALLKNLKIYLNASKAGGRQRFKDVFSVLNSDAFHKELRKRLPSETTRVMGNVSSQRALATKAFNERLK